MSMISGLPPIGRTGPLASASGGASLNTDQLSILKLLGVKPENISKVTHQSSASVANLQQQFQGIQVITPSQEQKQVLKAFNLENATMIMAANSDDIIKTIKKSFQELEEKELYEDKPLSEAQSKQLQNLLGLNNKQETLIFKSSQGGLELIRLSKKKIEDSIEGE